MTMTAGAIFRDVLGKKGLVEAMAAHSPLSAMLVAEAGFDAIWASGFELSAMYGVPDVSVVSMTQHLDMTRAMVDRSGLPVVADIDTGFGNAINVLYVIEQYERAGVAGCLEDVEDLLVVDAEDPLVRHEDLERRNAMVLYDDRDLPRDPVLLREPGIQVVELRHDPTREPAGQTAQLDDRSPPDRLDDRGGHVVETPDWPRRRHRPSGARAGRRYGSSRRWMPMTCVPDQ